MSHKEILQKIKSIINSSLNGDYKVFLFGSRVTGTASDTSDYDIGIEGPEEIQLSVLAKIQESVRDLNIFHKVDIVDFASVDKSFYKIAIKNRQWIS